MHAETDLCVSHKNLICFKLVLDRETPGTKMLKQSSKNCVDQVLYLCCRD